VNLEADGEPLPPQILNTAAFANGRFFGGGMQIAPRALIDDGLLDLVLLGAVGFRDFLLWGPRLYRGRHLSHPCIHCRKVTTVSATGPASVMLEVDGEPIGTLPTTVTILPRALRVRVNPGAPGLASR
jgi:diacylglycerol kinase (ATP)